MKRIDLSKEKVSRPIPQVTDIAALEGPDFGLSDSVMTQIVTELAEPVGVVDICVIAKVMSEKIKVAQKPKIL